MAALDPQRPILAPDVFSSRMRVQSAFFSASSWGFGELARIAATLPKDTRNDNRYSFFGRRGLIV